MSTIYTLNGKVLKNSANDKWLIKKEGATFDSVTIGSQTWMSKNLAIDDGHGGIYTQTVNYGQGEVTEYYYTWDAAMRIAESVQGWHLPTTTEWDTLATAVGGSDVAGTKLKSTYGWSSGNGTDDYGFAAFPAGRCYFGYFFELGSLTRFWTPNEDSSTDAYFRFFSTDAWMHSTYNNKTGSCTVRLVKDA